MILSYESFFLLPKSQSYSCWLASFQLHFTNCFSLHSLCENLDILGLGNGHLSLTWKIEFLCDWVLVTASVMRIATSQDDIVQFDLCWDADVLVAIQRHLLFVFATNTMGGRCGVMPSNSVVIINLQQVCTVTSKS